MKEIIKYVILVIIFQQSFPFEFIHLFNPLNYKMFGIQSVIMDILAWFQCLLSSFILKLIIKEIDFTIA